MEASTAQEASKLIADARGLSKQYGDQRLVDDFSMRVTRGARIGLVGPNGAGKTTLLKMLVGELEPDSGNVKLAQNLEFASLDQRRSALKADWTVAETLTEGSGDMVEVNGQRKHVMAYMKDFLFAPEQANTPIEVLSGGERARLLLARALALPSNVLILDEPTNDLDLETLDLLQDLIANYAGTVFLVSHDRDFIDRTCTSVLMSEGRGKWVEYAGGYSDMLAQRGAGVAKKNAPRKPAGSGDKPAAKPQQAAPERKRMANKDRYELKHLPEQIEALVTRIAALEKELASPALAQDPARMTEVSRKHSARPCRSALTRKTAGLSWKPCARSWKARLGDAGQQRSGWERRWTNLSGLSQTVGVCRAQQDGVQQQQVEAFKIGARGW